MDHQIEILLAKLEELNQQGGQWNISRETGQFLHDLVLKKKPEVMLEIGASNGYSTIWLAMAARHVGAKFYTFEFVPDKVRDLVHNLQIAKLIQYVDIIPDDANKRLKHWQEKVDFVFLDGRKNEYLAQLKFLEPNLNEGAIIVADNVISHKHVLEEYLYYVRNDKKYKSELKDIGTGLEITTKVN
ncbi:MAG: class I SAM-dependent methyltransferase [Candidatus Parcubacteria bacterium]|nr:class I SAM-dependent methyltransferase [Candidatus Parcubacteria bacterium]